MRGAVSTGAKIEEGEVAFLEVTANTEIGAFVDWGLPKELLVPFAEQTTEPRIGDRYAIGVYRDETGRYVGTMKVAEMLDKKERQWRFDEWVANVKRKPRRLDAAAYLGLERPSEKVRPIGFGSVEAGLFPRILGMCVRPGTSCMEGMGHGVDHPPAHHGTPPALLRSATGSCESPGRASNSPMMAMTGPSPVR